MLLMYTPFKPPLIKPPLLLNDEQDIFKLMDRLAIPTVIQKAMLLEIQCAVDRYFHDAHNNCVRSAVCSTNALMFFVIVESNGGETSLSYQVEDSPSRTRMRSFEDIAAFVALISKALHDEEDVEWREFLLKTMSEDVLKSWPETPQILGMRSVTKEKLGNQSASLKEEHDAQKQLDAVSQARKELLSLNSTIMDLHDALMAGKPALFTTGDGEVYASVTLGMISGEYYLWPGDSSSLYHSGSFYYRSKKIIDIVLKLEVLQEEFLKEHPDQ